MLSSWWWLLLFCNNVFEPPPHLLLFTFKSSVSFPFCCQTKLEKKENKSIKALVWHVHSFTLITNSKREMIYVSFIIQKRKKDWAQKVQRGKKTEKGEKSMVKLISLRKKKILRKNQTRTRRKRVREGERERKRGLWASGYELLFRPTDSDKSFS